MFDCAGEVCILFVDDHHIKKVTVTTCHSYRRDIHAKPSHQFVSRPLDRRSAYDGANGYNHPTCLVEHVVNTGNGQDADDGVAGRDENSLSLAVYNPSADTDGRGARFGTDMPLPIVG